MGLSGWCEELKDDDEITGNKMMERKGKKGRREEVDDKAKTERQKGRKRVDLDLEKRIKEAAWKEIRERQCNDRGGKKERKRK